MFTCGQNVSDDLNGKKSSIVVPIKDWEDVTCSVCMEYPHNAVLLLCSSHDKGCRPYMCGTSSRYSNCLDQYKNAYTKVTLPQTTLSSVGPNGGPALDPISGWPVEKCEEGAELACPLCRGQVKGWTVVESAREYLNAKKRTCMHDNCSFVGGYKELKKHVRLEHPSAKPREVDPDQEQKWRRLERERERDDVISTITSSMPGSVVFGDYVIERNPNPHGLDSDDEEGFDMDGLGRNNGGGLDMGIDSNLVNVLLLFHAFGPGGNMGAFGGMRRHEDDNDDEGGGDDDGDGDNSGMSLVNRLRHQGRLLLGRSGRRRRHRVVNRGQRRISDGIQRKNNMKWDLKSNLL
ncbi:Protein of unknown function DUF1644 [Cynara cardunculus var. scolymus]|uniref:Zinc finger, RING/FYVE/PHD-type n=1 Tax=Cynara cardunculus var. scolymus TaxID=59895 RepID=A0A103Y3D2_CYNCS|nr:Protein of unknown function DUF1644 [Cynara cardunculus var. scolymus]